MREFFGESDADEYGNNLGEQRSFGQLPHLVPENIKMIDMESKGVSAARNAGIDAAGGKYIGFVDADDWIEPDMFSVLCEKAESASADIAICNYYRNNGKIQHLVRFNINKNVLQN